MMAGEFMSDEYFRLALAEEEMKAVQQRIQKNFPSLFDVDGKVRGVGRGKYLRILAMFLADVWAR